MGPGLFFLRPRALDLQMSGTSNIPLPYNEPVLGYAPGSRRARRAQGHAHGRGLASAPRSRPSSAVARYAAATRTIVVSPPLPRRECWPRSHQADRATIEAAVTAARRGAARLGDTGASKTAPPSSSRPPSCWRPRGARPSTPPRCWARARRRSRRRSTRLRADRLPALQRRTSPSRSTTSSRSRARASGTAWTTARSRASSTRSRRSTSPRSAATCRPRRR